jgi:hypothetical protein
MSPRVLCGSRLDDVGGLAEVKSEAPMEISPMARLRGALENMLITRPWKPPARVQRVVKEALRELEESHDGT